MEKGHIREELEPDGSVVLIDSEGNKKPLMPEERPIVNLDIEIPFEMVNRIKQQIVIRHGLGELGSPSTPADELLIIVGQKLQEMGY